MIELSLGHSLRLSHTHTGRERNRTGEEGEREIKIISNKKIKDLRSKLAEKQAL